MNIRVMTLVAAAAASYAVSLAGATPGTFAGEYKGDEIRVVLQEVGKDYAGTIFYQGAQMPLKARAAGDVLTGKFVANKEAFDFEMKRTGTSVILTTQGTTYRMELIPKVNPLARPEATPPAAGATPLVGNWRSPTGTMRFNADGTGIANGEAFRYQSDGTNVTMSTPQGSVRLGYRVIGDAMTMTGPGGQIALTRIVEGRGGDAGGGGRILPELAGKWCYVANVNAVGGGARASNQCFTLQVDGRYEYYGETDSYGPAGGATSQSGDRGTWTATDTTFTARSTTGRVTTYAMQKRNHPKNGDPMLVMDGQAFVTFFQKAPWR